MGNAEDASSGAGGGSGLAGIGESPLPSGSGAGSVISGSGIYGSGVSGSYQVGGDGSAVGDDNDDVDDEMADDGEEDGDIEHERIEEGDSVSDRQRKKIKVCFRQFITDFQDVSQTADAAAAGKPGADADKTATNAGKNLNRAERDADERYKYRHRLKKMCQANEYIFLVSFKDIWASYPNMAYWLCDLPQEILPIFCEVVSGVNYAQSQS